MIRSEQKNRVPDEHGDYVVIDIETTGIGDNAEVIEAAALRVRNGIVTENCTSLVKYSKNIPEEIVRLTGITNAILAAEGKDPAIVAVMLAEFCGNDVIVGHNIMFDLRYLQRMFKENNIPPLRNKAVDTMRIARRKAKISEGYGLASVCRYYGIDTPVMHRASDDCYLTYRIYEKLKEK